MVLLSRQTGRRLASVAAFCAGGAIATAALLLALNLILGNKKIDYRVADVAPSSSPLFLRSMGALLGPPVAPGNRVRALLNGDEIFGAMLAAIRGAQRTITFETYIYWSGTIGQEFADALMSARVPELRSTS